MKAMIYRHSGGPEVIQAEDIEIPKPGAGQVLVRMAVSGVNPTDWKSRRGYGADPQGGWQIPNQDGAGRVVAVGEGVDPARVDERVWLWESAYQRPWGTAAEYTVVPAAQAVPLGSASYELGASLGVPFLTAHVCLTIGETGPDRLGPGALAGRTVLVQGGAGAVGNAAIQLARWAGATVISTVSSPEKADLAEAAGSTYVIDYHRQDVVAEVRKIAPDGVDLIVEVAASVNGPIDVAVLARNGAVAVYAGTGDETITLDIRPLMMLSARWQFVLLYTMPAETKAAAVEAVQAAVRQRAIRIDAPAGLPLHRFALDHTGSAHAAVAAGAVGKVLIKINDDPTLEETPMTVVAHLDLHLRPEELEKSYQLLNRILADTRAFDGCLGVDVLIDREDPAHVVAHERWASFEHDAAYRAWRATEAGASNLGSVLAGAPTLNSFQLADDI